MSVDKLMALADAYAGYTYNSTSGQEARTTLQAAIQSQAAEIERLTQQCKLFDAAAYKAKMEARTLIEAGKAEIASIEILNVALKEALEAVFTDITDAAANDRPSPLHAATKRKCDAAIEASKAAPKDYAALKATEQDMEIYRSIALAAQPVSAKNFQMTEEHVEVLATMLHFMPIGETELKKDLNEFCHDARSAIMSAPKHTIAHTVPNQLSITDFTKHLDKSVSAAILSSKLNISVMERSLHRMASNEARAELEMALVPLLAHINSGVDIGHGVMDTPEKSFFILSGFIDAAGIKETDKPQAVINKLQAAITEAYAESMSCGSPGLYERTSQRG